MYGFGDHWPSPEKTELLNTQQFPLPRPPRPPVNPLPFPSGRTGLGREEEAGRDSQEDLEVLEESDALGVRGDIHGRGHPGAEVLKREKRITSIRALRNSG